MEKGQWVMTRGINDAVAGNTEFSKEIVTATARYNSNDWGATRKPSCQWQVGSQSSVSRQARSALAMRPTGAVREDEVDERGGDLCDEDKKLNDDAVKSNKDRIVASYKTSKGKVYIITEWDRSVTTILFANEY